MTILGAGAMGSWFGGMLALSGQNLTLLTTNREHRDAINRDGLKLLQDGSERTARLAARDPADYTGPADLVMLFTKSFQSDAALSAIAHTLDADTHVLTLQNGLGNSETIARYVPLARVLIGVTMMPVDRVGPGVVAATGQGATYFNSALEQELPLCRELAALFERAGIEAHVDADIHRRIWSKVAFNAGMNAVAGLAHGTPGSIGDTPGARELLYAVAREVAAVSASAGVAIDLDAVVETIDFACAEHRDHMPSMVRDLLAGKRTEVDALNGAVVAAGEKYGVETPLNRLLETLVRVAELSHRRYPPGGPAQA